MREIYKIPLTNAILDLFDESHSIILDSVGGK